MPLDVARTTIRDAAAPPEKHIFAAGKLSETAIAEHGLTEPSVSVEDLLECIRRGHYAAELAASALNVVLGRRSVEELRPEDHITDLAFWLEYSEAARSLK